MGRKGKGGWRWWYVLHPGVWVFVGLFGLGTAASWIAGLRRTVTTEQARRRAGEFADATFALLPKGLSVERFGGVDAVRGDPFARGLDGGVSTEQVFRIAGIRTATVLPAMDLIGSHWVRNGFAVDRDDRVGPNPALVLKERRAPRGARITLVLQGYERGDLYVTVGTEDSWPDGRRPRRR
ncbi:hypothetical protein [Yinghuangia soli]|uniref:Uncharacterized protein n=1 Tax=Yinghuangia soli TaxID=2908204 RepID=A0AA41Q746_9ACTN|nr:hypothetical protein [Yinghuangia soli]MCF2532834.1 hypothetical protein [Yinghuangia soli]